MTLDRLLKIQIAGVAAGIAVPITDNAGSITVDGTVAVSNASFPVTDNGGSLTVDGTVTISDGGGSITVDGTIAVTGVSTLAEQQTQTTALQLIDDVVFTDDGAFSPGTSKGLAIGAQCDETATDSVDEGDFGVLRMTAARELLVKVNQALPSGTNNIGDVDILSIAAGDNNIGNVDIVTMPAVAGAAAHDAAVSGNPVRVAGRAMLANGTAVAEDDTTDIATDNQGRVVVTPHVPRDLVTHQTTTITSSVAETTILTAGAASVFHDLTQLVITNSSSTALIVTLKDATTGTTRAIFALAANGGIVVNFGTVPACQAAAANNWTLTCGTSVASIYVYAQAIKRIA